MQEKTKSGWRIGNGRWQALRVFVMAWCFFVAASSLCAQETSTTKRTAGRAGYRIAGVVLDDATERPVAGAELSIALEAGELKVKADDAGRFAFEGMEPGKYAVSAAAPGYVFESYRQHGAFATAMAVGNGLDSEHMVFRLHQQVVILGTVTDERGEAVRKAQVMLFVEDRWQGKRTVRMAAQAETDDRGAYRFAHLQGGKYYVAVSARPWYAQSAVTSQAETLAQSMSADQGEGATEAESREGRRMVVVDGARTNGKMEPKLDVVYATTFYPGVTDEQSAGELVVSAGETQEADVRLEAVPAMRVRVTNVPGDQENGSGMGVGATQSIFGTRELGLQVVTGEVAPGVVELAGLPPGDVSLVLSDNRNGDWENRTIHTNARDGDSFDARASATRVSVTGRVIAEDATSTATGANVVLNGKDGQTLSRRVQRDGTFSFEGVEAGRYEVHTELGGGEYVREMTATGAKVDGEEVKIDGTEAVQLVIRMGRGLGQVKGVVKVEGKPEAGMMVLLVPAAGGNLERDARMDQSDSDGTFLLGRIRPGKYVLMAIEDGWDLEWQNEEVLRGYREKGQVLEVGENEVKTVVAEKQKRRLEDGK